MKMKFDHLSHKIIMASVLLFLITPATAQVSISQNHPELKWEIFETDHFKIIFHQGIETIANEVAVIAEEIHAPVTNDLGVSPPQKTPIVVTDYLDYTNGLANPLGHQITLWTKSETKYTTGTVAWLKPLVAHEYAHIVSFWAVRDFPGFWRELLALGFVPTWFLEGIAEYEAEKWCNNRDMLLRVVAYHRELLANKKLTGFIGADQIDSRLVYEQGHSIIRFIAGKFGKDKIPLIIQNFRKMPVSFNLALKRSIGLSEKELFNAWYEEINIHYEQEYEKYESVTETGQELKTPFQAPYGARWSPDGKKLALVAINNYDEHVKELYLSDSKTLNFRKIAGPYVQSFFSWSPDNKSIVYAQDHIVKTGAEICDLFLVDVETTRKMKLTDHERACDPCFSPNGDKIVYTIHRGTKSDISILDLNSKQRTIITNFPDWTEVFTPAWSPDGEKIAFSIFDSTGNRDICTIHPDGTNFTKLTDDPVDDRFPSWAPDGKNIAFISYKNNIPNLYVLDLESDNTRQITNSPGGILNPCWHSDGDKIGVIAFENRDQTNLVIVPFNSDKTEFSVKSKSLDFHQVLSSSAQTLLSPMPRHNYTTQTQAYQPLRHFRPQILLPYLDSDEKKWQPGFITFVADPLEKHSLMASATYGSRLHFNLDYTNRQLPPTIQFSLYKTTIDHGDFLRIIEQDKTSRYLPLYENYWSGSLTFSYNINFGKSILSNHLLWFRPTFTYRDFINNKDYENIDSRDWAFPFFKGWSNSLTLGYVWQTYRPDISYDIHPKSGKTFSIYLKKSAKWLGSELNYSQIGVTGIYRKELFIPEHILALLTYFNIHQGDQPIQSRYSIGSQALRGISHSQEGDRQFFSNLEYRFPLIRDFGLKFWILYFEKFSGALFFDFGKAWGSYLQTIEKKSVQSFNNVDWLKTTGIEIRHRFYIFGKIPVVFGGGYSIDLTNSNERSFYYRLGSVF